MDKKNQKEKPEEENLEEKLTRRGLLKLGLGLSAAAIAAGIAIPSILTCRNRSSNEAISPTPIVIEKNIIQTEYACFLEDNIVYVVGDRFGDQYNLSLRAAGKEAPKPKEVLNFEALAKTRGYSDFSIHRVYSGLDEKVVTFSADYSIQGEGIFHGVYIVNPFAKDPLENTRQIFRAYKEDERGFYEMQYVISQDSKHAIIKLTSYSHIGFGKIEQWYKVPLATHISFSQDNAPLASPQDIKYFEEELKRREGLRDEGILDQRGGNIIKKEELEEIIHNDLSK